MPDPRFSAPEKLTLILILFLLATGFFLFYTDLQGFENFLEEDGIAEWLTVAGLLLGTIVCFYRLVKLLHKKSKWFLFVTLGLGLFLFFAAGEEISWGQRLFGVETPAYFKQHNSQQETNLHNLVLGEVKINKLVFSFILIGLLAIFLSVVPFLYQKSNAAKRFLDASAVPVPQLYQVLAFIVVFILTSLIPHPKKAELLECCGALLFYLIVAYPKNKRIFTAA